MLHAYTARFNVTGILKSFWISGGSKPDLTWQIDNAYMHRRKKYISRVCLSGSLEIMNSAWRSQMRRGLLLLYFSSYALKQPADPLDLSTVCSNVAVCMCVWFFLGESICVRGGLASGLHCIRHSVSIACNHVTQIVV